MAAKTQTITVAAAQIAARLMNEAESTLASLQAAIEQAADRRVDLLVMPECAYPAYLLGSVQSYRNGTHLPSGEFLAWLSKHACEHRLHIVCGFVEDDGRNLYNSAVLLDDRGREAGRTRKRFLWHMDHEWFQPGDEIRAYDTAIGRIGIIICAEGRDPELIATLVADGAELIAMPTCWINGARDPGKYENPQVEFLMEARAREFGVPFVCADKSGLELAATGYVGQSCIVRSDGSVAAAAPPAGEAVVAARLSLDGTGRKVWVNEKRRERLLRGPAYVGRTVEPRTVTVAAVSGAVVAGRLTDGMGEGLFGPLRKHGVELLLANVADEAQAERLEMLARAFDMHAVAFPHRADVHAAGPARVGCVSGQWTCTFPAARALALDGADIVMCFDMPDHLSLVRARALENRVFVMGTSQQAAVVISPDGAILARDVAESGGGAAIATIDLGQAAQKNVAPGTDIFTERRPELYRF